jgi:protein phosphatase 2C family protein 2/3
MRNQEVATFVRKYIAQDIPLKEICEKLMDSCLADKTNTGGVGCDNMTVEIVAFLNGQSEQEWYQKIKLAVGPSSSSINDSSDENTSTGEPELKKHRPDGLKSESRQYSVDELKNAPDITTSFSLTADNDTNYNAEEQHQEAEEQHQEAEEQHQEAKEQEQS